MLEALIGVLSGARSDQFQSLLAEVIRTQGDLRNRITPRYRHDERWDDLVHCLRLDGYRIDGQKLTAVDPTVEGAEPLEDDLSGELRRSGLAETEDIFRMMNNSADAFRKVPPVVHPSDLDTQGLDF